MYPVTRGENMSSYQLNLTNTETKKFKWIVILLGIIGITSFYDNLIENPIFYYLKYVSVVLFFFVIWSEKKHKINWSAYRGLAFISILITSSLHLFSVPSDGVITSIFYVILIWFLSFGIIYLFPYLNEKEFLLITTFFLICTYTLAVLPSLITMNNSSYFYLVGDRYRFLGIFNNPNDLSRFSLLVILLSLRLFTVYKSVVIRIIFLLMISSSFIIINLTDARSGLLTGSLAVLLYILITFIFYRLPTLIKLFLGFALSATLIFIMFYFLNTINIGSYNFNDISSGRLEIWMNAIDANIFQQLFGQGQASRIIMASGYIEIIRYFGFVGLFIWLIVILILLVRKILSAISNPSSNEYFGIGVILLFLFFYIFEGGMLSFGNIASLYFWIELTKTTIATNDKKQKNKI